MARPQDESPNGKKLTPKQRAFIAAYVSNGFNATQAAITAGYSEATAYSIGWENLRKPEIKSEIDSFLADYSMGPKEIIARLTAHARGDIGDLWNEDEGQIDWPKARADGATVLIKSFTHKTTRITQKDGTDIETFEDKIELHNPQVALQLLGKQHGLFSDKLKIEITWQDEAVQLIKSGQLDYPTALETFENNDALVRDLFAKAQIPVSS